MAREGAIEVEGAIVEVLSNGTCRVELSNGHRVLAYVAGKAKLSFVRLAPGDRVRLEMSPYDLSQGRIIVEDRTDL
ncbi:MAG: translation initiation factor IF-1 [Limisphaerales bacterium]